MSENIIHVEFALKVGSITSNPKLPEIDAVSSDELSVPVFESLVSNTSWLPDLCMQKTDAESARVVQDKARARSNLPDLTPLPPSHRKDYSKFKPLVMAYQTLGVVYGDLGTSPLYVYPTINIKAPDENDYLGVLSLIFWTLTAIGLFKYVFIVLHADNYGEGGTFALYSQLCHHTTIAQQTANKYNNLVSDTKPRFLSDSRDRHLSSEGAFRFEGKKTAQRLLLFISMIGTCMLIGDGILTPAISVLSAMSGLQHVSKSVKPATVLWLSATVLVLLFMLQRFGTKHVSLLFSPIMAIWLVTTPLIGVYNIAAYYPGIFKAFSPHYIILFFAKNGKDGWLILGGTALCITGAEAMFADLGHFNRPSIQLAFSTMVYPSVILTYAGQTAYLIKHPADHREAFYKFVPQCVYWPMFLVATLAAIVASQGLISAVFSIIKQSVALDCFPRVKLVHTYSEKEGQIYSPEINYSLMLLCLLVLFGFQGGPKLGNAFGVAVMFVMIITTILMTVLMLEIWRTRTLALFFFLFFVVIEGTYLSAVLIKVTDGGWLPFVFAIFLAIIMFSWYYGRQKKFECEMKNRVSLDGLGALLTRTELHRVPGVCLFYTNLMNEVPPVMMHYVKNVKSLHQVIIFTTIRCVPVATVLRSERFSVEQLGYRGIYRCVAQYGYSDMLSIGGEEFLNEVFTSLTDYFQSRHECQDELPSVESLLCMSEDIAELQNAKEAGAVYVLGKSGFETNDKTGWVQKILLGKIYNFLHKNCRSAMAFLKIPASKHMEIGLRYEV